MFSDRRRCRLAPICDTMYGSGSVRVRCATELSEKLGWACAWLSGMGGCSNFRGGK